MSGVKTPLGVAVQEEKQIDHHSYDRKPDTPGFPRNEPLFDIDGAPNPENLAGYEDENYGEVDQIKGVELRRNVLPGMQHEQGSTAERSDASERRHAERI